MSRYAIYLRVSTEEQARGENKSLDNQLHRCKTYISSVLDEPHGAERALIYRDGGFSGKNLDRPAFQEMLQAAKDGQIHTIVFTELSRVSRSVLDFLQLTQTLSDLNIQFVSLRERFDTTSPQGRLLLTLTMALNQFEREQVSLRVKLNLKARSERGLWNGGTLPLGYAYDPKKSGHLLVVEEEAQIVRHVYEKYLEAGSISGLQVLLEDEAIMSPRSFDKDHEDKGKPFRDATLRYMLGNVTYLGFKEVNPENRKLTPEQEARIPQGDRYKLVEGEWEPIIEEELGRKVRELLEFNRERRGSKTKPVKYDFLFTNLAYCGECRSPLIRESAKCNSYFNYQHEENADEVTCTTKRWRADTVETSVLLRLLRLSEDKKQLAQAIDYSEELLQSEWHSIPIEINKGKRRIEVLKSERDRLHRSLLHLEPTSLPQSVLSDIKNRDR